MEKFPPFILFMKELEPTANYFVASAHNINERDRLMALKLILAHAFKAGYESKKINELLNKPSTKLL